MDSSNVRLDLGPFARDNFDAGLRTGVRDLTVDSCVQLEALWLDHVLSRWRNPQPAGPQNPLRSESNRLWCSLC